MPWHSPLGFICFFMNIQYFCIRKSIYHLCSTMKFLTILIVLLWSGIAAAAPSDLIFKKIGQQQGLPHVTVNCIASDRHGYLWVATPDGISRYDSYEFTNYEPLASQSYNKPGIKSVVSVAGEIYAAADNIVYHYNEDTDSFEHHAIPDRNRSIRVMLSVGDNRLVLGTDHGLFSYSISDSTFTQITPRLDDPVNSIAVLDGCLYAGLSKKGVARISKDGTFSFLPLPTDTDVNELLADGRSLLIGTEGRGVFRYQPGTDTITRYHLLPSDSHVRALEFDNKKNLWAGTFNGLYIVNADGESVTNIPTGEYGISHSSVRDIFSDNQGGVWLGTFFGGLNYYNPLNNQISSLRKGSVKGRSLNDNIVSTIVEDKNHNVWIGTNNGGVNVYNPTDGSFRYYTDTDGLGSNDVKAIYIDDKTNKAYIGTHIGAMSLLDINSGRIKSANIPSRNVFAIEPSLDGRLWLNAFNYLYLYDKSTESIVDSIRIAGNGRNLKRSTGLFRDGKKRLWVYGEDGLAVFKENRGDLEPVNFLPEDFIEKMPGVGDVFQDTKHRLWLATNSGLWAFDASGKEIMHFTEADGLPSRIVNALAEDPSGKLWVCTNRGIVRVDASDGHIDNFAAYDNQANNTVLFKSILNTSNGKLMLGGIDGIRILNPSVFEANPYTPTPMITGLRLFDKPVKPGDETGLLEKNISQTDNITFNSDQTSFTIEFTVCNFLSGGNNAFYYMLEGLDNKWIPVQTGVRSVTYSNLPAGKYRFMLKAANSDGMMSDGIASTGITILPVWYQSWWAMTLWILLSVAATAFVIRLIWHRKMLAAKMAMQQADFERQQEAEEMKVRFFINLSHELRTPLTLMMLPVDELLALKNNPVVTDKLTTVKNNTLRILHIVNQLLDYRRAEMGMFKLKVRPTDINMLARRIFDSYETVARHKDIKYTLESTIDSHGIILDGDYVELILNNLLSNAFKYTPKGQSVSLGLAVDSGKLVITVSDTGCGIPQDKIQRIFTRFYQVNDASNGNGIGLSLVKRLVELHHGEISAESSLGEGTRFTVSLPIGSEAYSDEELHAGEESAQAGSNVDSTPYIHIPDISDADTAADFDTRAGDADDKRPAVLIVDDNPEILKYIGDSLCESYKVLLAANGAKAIELLSTDNIDLIITDVMMPDVDGVQLCRAVKRNLRTSHIPVIMLSAKSDLADQMDGMNVGADDYIPKPFSLELLKAKIKNQLRTRVRLIDHYTNSTDIEPAKIAVNPLDEEFLTKAVKVMNEHLDDSQFSTDAFAKEMCMSRSNLHLKMKALTGESTSDFIRRVRLNKALELLKTNRYTVSEVSAMVGYGSPSYFTTSFKKFFGYSPSEVVRKD